MKKKTKIMDTLYTLTNAANRMQKELEVLADRMSELNDAIEEELRDNPEETDGSYD
jgi:hypothetical protein